MDDNGTHKKRLVAMGYAFGIVQRDWANGKSIEEKALRYRNIGICLSAASCSDLLLEEIRHVALILGQIGVKKSMKDIIECVRRLLLEYNDRGCGIEVFGAYIDAVISGLRSDYKED